MGMIEVNFSKLKTKCLESLQSGEIDIEDVKDFLIDKYSSPDSRDGSDIITKLLESATNLRGIFRELSKNRLWNYCNYYLLESFIERFLCNDHELNRMLKEYKQELTGHVLAQKISTYLHATRYKHSIVTTSDSELSADETTSDFSLQPEHKIFHKLSIKIDLNVTDHSVHYVYHLWESLANQFLIPQVAMILHTIAEGCIGITWLIPANLVKHVTRMIHETANMFAEQHILRVMLEEQCIYPLQTELPPPETNLPLSETGTPLLETEHPLLEAKYPLLETKSPLTETNPPLLELPETKPPPQETIHPLMETELLETEALLESDPLLETEAFLESETAALKRKVCLVHMHYIILPMWDVSNSCVVHL